MIRALAGLGHDVTFYEPDVYDRQNNRDIDPPDWCRVVVYDGTREAVAADLVAGLVALASAENPGQPVNLGNPGEFTVAELARLVLDLTGSDSPIEHRPLPVDDLQRRRPDITVARRRLGWSPKVLLSEGLAPNIVYFAARLGADRTLLGAGRRRPAVPQSETHIPL